MKVETNRAGKLKRMPTDYECFIPNNLTNVEINIDAEMNLLLNKAYLLLGRLDGMAITLPDIDLFVSMYVQKEAVISSQIEGTQASLIDVLQKEQRNGKIKETEEIVNYIKAANYAFKRLQDLPLCMRLIRETHSILLSNVRGNEKTPGEFRKSQNWIGYAGCTLNTASFVPPSPEDMEGALSDLEKYINEDDSISEIIKAALIHYQFETIHPFLDGNGRMGRLLIVLFLKEIGLVEYPVLYLSYFFKKNRNRYYELLNNVRMKGEFENWIKFFISGICEVSENAISSIQKIVELKKKDMEKIRNVPNGNISNLLLVYDYLLKHPFVETEDIRLLLHSSKPTVAKLQEILTELTILALVEDKKRYKQYVYSSYVDILSEGTLL
ncbi:Fic family protein [Treponema phagedenis]|uniref:Fic family protein n=1 Tax=Treponema phagedenis TaxID=162 RepID=UPI0004668E2A|nr:Fic family protein [Treponema phagedenis]NVP24338.1 Fic family protein [Treponema phagedenis]QKS91622.1 Fic family protein [Treponema phagedenis]QLC59842.1 Fic family protein [Treponema phagedenis]QSH95693.1 Fic family protein [Treponema phagedenis]